MWPILLHKKYMKIMFLKRLPLIAGTNELMPVRISFQIIMVRLQRVTFMALHNYLGLTYELINPVSTVKSLI